MIIIGDIHLKRKEPYFTGLKKLFDYFVEEYGEEKQIIFTGDFFDSCSPHWDLVTYAQQILKKFRSVIILDGNHDKKAIKGNSLVALKELSNVTIISEVTLCNVEEFNILFLPHRYRKEEIEDYHNLTSKHDLVITHIVPTECQFRDEGIDLKAEAKLYIHGHTHVPISFTHGKQLHEVIGVPQPTRKGEEGFKPCIFKITKDKDENPYLQKMSLPVYMTIKEIEFGELPENLNDLYIVKNAPSMNMVDDMYKDHYIIREATTLLVDNKEGKEQSTIEIGNFDLLQTFKDYAEGEEKSPEVIDECLLCLKEAETTN